MAYPEMSNKYDRVFGLGLGRLSMGKKPITTVASGRSRRLGRSARWRRCFLQRHPTRNGDNHSPTRALRAAQGPKGWS
jgi:hypothetical protein